jgi:tricorn protease
VIGRHCGDPARWKRYKGGTAGVLWARENSKEKFKRILKNIPTNISSPRLIGDKIYFITDYQGYGNVYECHISGKNLKRLTHSDNYYCRNLETDGENLVYHAGGDIYLLNLETKTNKKLDIFCPSSGVQAQPRFSNAAKYLSNGVVSNDLQKIAVISRGHAFLMAPFKGGVTNLDKLGDVRFGTPKFTFDSKFLIYSGSNSELDEHLISFDIEKGTSKKLFPKQDWGKIRSVHTSPKKALAVIENTRQELWLADYASEKLSLIEKAEYVIEGISWSPCGRYVAYSTNINKAQSAIKIFDTEKKKLQQLMQPVLSDTQPSFDPTGKYLYILSVREFGPVYNETHFDLGFPKALKPYVVVLAKDTLSPFEAHLESPKNPDAEEKKDDKKEKPEIKTVIDFEDIEHRVLAFPVEFGGYSQIRAITGGLMYTRRRVDPILSTNFYDNMDGNELFVYRFEKAKEEFFHGGVRHFIVTPSGNHMLIRTSDHLRLISTQENAPAGHQYGKADGWCDLDRIRLHIEPKEEWKQMYREAWKLQKEHFWRENMSNVDWSYVYRKYWPLLSRIKTRTEFSDLLWEMQGELGTSHAYEMGGDYNRVPQATPTGFLGAQLRFDEEKNAMLVKEIYRGDSFIPGTDSPLLKPGVSMKEGDLILAVDAQKFDSPLGFWSSLEHKAGISVELTIQRRGKKETEKVNVEPLRSLGKLLYRKWTEQNKKYVHEKSNGKLGYTHVPDMGPAGYGEFYRHYISEIIRDGMVVDVRYNGGGHVSQHLLKVLAQKPLGMDVTRHMGSFTYPSYAVRGPIIALTNELAGSDGDIFSHSFKLMKLGPLIGKRTWGGVIGIWARHALRDMTITTQPEFSYYFKDVGWDVENYGTDPDIEVDISPDDFAAGKDPQLDKAIELGISALRKNPAFDIKVKEFPDLRPPKTLGT